MIASANLGGFFAAHALWLMSKGSPLIPMLGYASSDGSRTLERFRQGDHAALLARAKRELESNAMRADAAALVYGSRAMRRNREVDAIVVELRDYAVPKAAATLAVAWSLGAHQRLRVRRPDFVASEECEMFTRDSILISFIAGMRSHREIGSVCGPSFDDSF